MRLLSLDFDPVYDGAVREAFFGDRSVFDFDVVVWDPAQTLATYVLPAYQSYFRGLPSLDEARSVRIRSDIKRRRSEFAEFVNAGRTLIVIVRPPQEFYIDDGQREYSGTGRNRAVTRLWTKVDLLSTLPIKEIEFSKAAGDRIELVGSGPMVSLLKKYSDKLTYEAVITEAPGIALARVTGTVRTLGSVFRSQADGHLILLPVIDLLDDEAQRSGLDDGDKDDEYDGDLDDDDDDDSYSAEAPEFQRDLLNAVRDLTGAKEISRPAWSQRYVTKEQQALSSKVATQQARVESARQRLADLQQEKERLERVDQLFLGTGRVLELEVRKVLELLGGDVTDPEPGRDDWRVAFPEGNAVVEVKGVNKSAAEKHCAQLEKWVAASLLETGETVKGVLIVNTWRELPLNQRTGQSFPKQMLPYAKARNHCLITGLQLYVIQSEITNKAHAKAWRRKILSTAGLVEGCDDWSSLIEEITSDEPAEA